MKTITTQKDIVSKINEIQPALKYHFAVKEIKLINPLIDYSDLENDNIDLLVEFDEPIGWKFFTLELYLEKAFNRKVDLTTKGFLSRN